jgi:hypothetical protein
MSSLAFNLLLNLFILIIVSSEIDSLLVRGVKEDVLEVEIELILLNSGP